MLTWIGNPCDASGIALPSMVSTDCFIDAPNVHFGPTGVSTTGEMYMDGKSGYRFTPWTEIMGCASPVSMGGGCNVREGNVSYWPACSTGRNSCQDPYVQQSKHPLHIPAACISQVDPVPATPPLLSDIVTIVSAHPISVDRTGEQMVNSSSTFDRLQTPHCGTTTAPLAQFSHGRVDTGSALLTAEMQQMQAGQTNVDCPDSICDLSSFRSVFLGAKDDQVKKILSRCGKWTECASGSKSSEWTRVELDKPKVPEKSKILGGLTGRSAEDVQGRYPLRKFGPVPTEKAEHVKRERERRIQLRAMYKTLDHLIPAPSRTAKRDRTAIVNDALDYVKELRKKVEKLRSYKSKILVSDALTQDIARHNEDKNGGESPAFKTDANRGCEQSATMLQGSEDYFEAYLNEDVSVYTGSEDHVFVNINCKPRPNLISVVLQSLSLLQLEVVQYSFTKLCGDF